jgi:hypothetical protein
VSVGTEIWREAVWEQFGATLAMLERAIVACPEPLWTSRAGSRDFWHLVYHTLFFTDLNLSGTTDGFSPPPPFSMSELDPANLLPDRTYTKDEMLEYTRYCRDKGRTTLQSLTDLEAVRVIEFDWVRMKFGELLLYNMRHVQHHTAQLNLLLRQSDVEPPDWVGRASGDSRP